MAENIEAKILNLQGFLPETADLYFVICPISKVL